MNIKPLSNQIQSTNIKQKKETLPPDIIQMVMKFMTTRERLIFVVATRKNKEIVHRYKVMTIEGIGKGDSELLNEYLRFFNPTLPKNGIWGSHLIISGFQLWGRQKREETEGNKKKELLAIRWACNNDQAEVVKSLIKDVRVDPSGEETAFAQACKKGYIEVVKLLREDKRINPSANNNEAINLAIFCNRPKIVDLLLKDDRVDPSGKEKAFDHACRQGYTEVVKLLLEDKRINPSDDYCYALLDATRYDQPVVVDLLLKDGRVAPSDHYNIAFRMALKHGFTEIVKLLLKNERIKLSKGDKNRAAYKAAKKGHLDIVTLLLNDPDVDPSYSNNYFLRWASEKGHREIVTFLLEDERVNPYDKGYDGKNAKDLALENGHTEIAKLFPSRFSAFVPKKCVIQ